MSDLDQFRSFEFYRQTAIWSFLVELQSKAGDMDAQRRLVLQMLGVTTEEDARHPFNVLPSGAHVTVRPLTYEEHRIIYAASELMNIEIPQGEFAHYDYGDYLETLGSKPK